MARCERCDEQIKSGKAFTVVYYGRVMLRSCSLVCIGLAIAEGWDEAALREVQRG